MPYRVILTSAEMCLGNCGFAVGHFSKSCVAVLAACCIDAPGFETPVICNEVLVLTAFRSYAFMGLEQQAPAWPIETPQHSSPLSVEGTGPQQLSYRGRASVKVPAVRTHNTGCDPRPGNGAVECPRSIVVPANMVSTLNSIAEQPHYKLLQGVHVLNVTMSSKSRP